MRKLFAVFLFFLLIPAVSLASLAPTLTVTQDTAEVSGAGIRVTLAVDAPGAVTVQLFSYAESWLKDLFSMRAGTGEMSLHWDGYVGGVRVPAGRYSLIITYEPQGGMAQQRYLHFDVMPMSTPYSAVRDGTFWAMPPGEIDDAVIWDVLTQPITVYDNGRIGATGHMYLMENPDGTGGRIAQIHGKSQGLHVLGEVNEHGYVLVEAFSNYDPSFQPISALAREHAFEVKQGYIKADGLVTIPVNQQIGFLVDKLTQRLYIFIDGVRVTELFISTGKNTSEKYFYETTAGEFTTIAYTASFMQSGLYNAMGIRFNGGNLLHEVPCQIDEEGVQNYIPFEKLLGQKASGGCIRVQRHKSAEGYNHTWIWETLDREERYKVLVWNDLNRVDTPAVWRESP